MLKECDGRQADFKKTFTDKVRQGKKKVVIIKQVGGQGAMHDNHYCRMNLLVMPVVGPIST